MRESFQPNIGGNCSTVITRWTAGQQVKRSSLHLGHGWYKKLISSGYHWFSIALQCRTVAQNTIHFISFQPLIYKQELWSALKYLLDVRNISLVVKSAEWVTGPVYTLWQSYISYGDIVTLQVERIYSWPLEGSTHWLGDAYPLKILNGPVTSVQTYKSGNVLKRKPFIWVMTSSVFMHSLYGMFIVPFIIYNIT